MARPVKNGLSYFPVDVDIFEDDKIQFVSAKFGVKGEGVFFRLLANIYRNGYYIEFDEDVQLLFSKHCGLERNDNVTINVVEELLKRGFFDKDTFDRFSVLTSKGIQKRYVKICKDSKRTLDNILPKYDLIREETRIIREETRIIPRKSTQSKEKESKEKESKEDYGKGENSENDFVLPAVIDSRKDITPLGGRLDKEFLKKDLLESDYCNMQAHRDGVSSEHYEETVDFFIEQKFGLGENEKWKDLQDARRNFTNWVPYHIQNKNKNASNSNQQATDGWHKPAGISRIFAGSSTGQKNKPRFIIPTADELPDFSYAGREL